MRNTTIISIIAVVISVVALFSALKAGTVPFGGYTVSYWDTAEGYKVDGTTIINGDGVITGSSQTLSGTLTVSGETNLDTLIQGGDVTAVATDTDYTLTAAQVCDSSVITVELSSAAGKNITLPATTTLEADCLTANGDTKTILFRNITATAATTTTIVAGSGIDLLEPDGQNVIIGGGNDALITFVRYTANEIAVVVDELIDAD